VPTYQKRGVLPKRKHTVFKDSKGSILYEELFSTDGFKGIYSTRYHSYLPTSIKKVKKRKRVETSVCDEYGGLPLHILPHDRKERVLDSFPTMLASLTGQTSSGIHHEGN